VAQEGFAIEAEETGEAVEIVIEKRWRRSGGRSALASYKSEAIRIAERLCGRPDSRRKRDSRRARECCETGSRDRRSNRRGAEKKFSEAAEIVLEGLFIEGMESPL